MSRRLEQMRSLVQAHPDNPLAWYSLALEQKKTDLPGALVTFADLMARHPNYVATYFHYGQALVAAGEDEQAKAVYETGLRVANAAGDTHAASELQSALDLV